MSGIRLSVLLFSLLYVFSIQAQTDTEFWFAVPEVTDLHGDRPIYLRMAALDAPADVTVSIPANPNFVPINVNIAANTQQSVDLTPFIDSLENRAPNSVLKRGLHIEATERITAYYEVLGSSPSFGIVNSDIFVLKGYNALGTEFITPFQTFWDNVESYNAWSSFDIVATEDNTTITITPSKLAFGDIPANIPFTITLNRGETYSVWAFNIYANYRLSGSKIVADKPIAVTVKDDSIFESGAYDLAGDQLVPVELTGQDFVLFSPSSPTATNRAFVVATQNNTKIFANGSTSPIASINKGQTYNYNITGNVEYLRTSLPVYVFQVTGVDNELGGALLPAFGECTGSPQVSLIRTSELEFTTNILVEAGAEDYFELDGDPSIITGDLFSFVPGTNQEWVYASISFPSSVIVPGNAYIVTNDSADFHLGVIVAENGFSFRYGYFSDFASGVELGADKAFCVGDSATLNAGIGKDDYLWNTGQTTSSITVKDSGTYYVTAQRELCIFKDSIHVRLYPKPHDAILYDDTSFCKNAKVTIKTDTGFVNHRWSNGSFFPSIQPNTSGKYKVNLKTRFGCKTKDSVQVNIQPLPNTKIYYNTNKDIICNNDLVTLEADPGFKHYLWNTGDTTQTITSPHIFNFSVQVTDFNNCKGSSSVFIDCSLYISVPNTFTPNGDGINDFFVLEGLPGDGWVLTIMNRWGQQIYQKEKYDNSWDGDGLADGTYYYLLENRYSDTKHKGWVQIIR